MTVESASDNLSKEFYRSVKEGDGWPVEADDSLNDACRAMIAAVADEYGEAWLGKINLHGDERHGKHPVIWKWDGELVYNFGADFVVKAYDEELVRLIRERDDAEYTTAEADVERIDKIFDRLYEIGGRHLFWT